MKTASLRRQTQIGQVAAAQGEAPSGFKTMKTASLRRQTQIGQVAAEQGEAPVVQVSRQ